MEDYKYGMRGTNGLDKLLSYYFYNFILFRTSTIYLRIYTAVSNAHILLKTTSNAVRGTLGYDLLSFTELHIILLWNEVRLDHEPRKFLPPLINI